MTSSGKSLLRKLTAGEWSKSASPRPGANTECGQTQRTVEMSHKEWLQYDPNEKPPDNRPFIVRLLASIRISPKVNLKGVHGAEIKGGTDF
jgi:hypothetical protein